MEEIIEINGVQPDLRSLKRLLPLSIGLGVFDYAFHETVLKTAPTLLKLPMLYSFWTAIFTTIMLTSYHSLKREGKFNESTNTRSKIKSVLPLGLVGLVAEDTGYWVARTVTEGEKINPYPVNNWWSNYFWQPTKINLQSLTIKLPHFGDPSPLLVPWGYLAAGLLFSLYALVEYLRLKPLLELKKRFEKDESDVLRRIQFSQKYKQEMELKKTLGIITVYK